VFQVVEVGAVGMLMCGRSVIWVATSRCAFCSLLLCLVLQYYITAHIKPGLVMTPAQPLSPHGGFLVAASSCLSNARALSPARMPAVAVGLAQGGWVVLPWRAHLCEPHVMEALLPETADEVLLNCWRWEGRG
jgi:hypothetical protein